MSPKNDLTVVIQNVVTNNPTPVIVIPSFRNYGKKKIVQYHSLHHLTVVMKNRGINRGNYHTPVHGNPFFPVNMTEKRNKIVQYHPLNQLAVVIKNRGINCGIKPPHTCSC